MLLATLLAAADGFRRLDLLLIAINAALAIRALVILWRGARSRRHTVRGTYYAVMATLAAFYVVGYLALLAGIVDRLTWSYMMSWVAPFAWAIVWPAAPTIKAAEDDADRLQLEEAATCLVEAHLANERLQRSMVDLREAPPRP